MPENQIKISEINEKSVWENFLLECEEKTFLGSWNWGEFQKMMGNKIWRLGIFENSRDPISVALVIKICAKRGTFLFVPHGSVLRSSTNPKSQTPNLKQIQNSKFQILNTLLESLKKIAKEERASFVRIAPIWERNEENIEIFRILGFRDAPIHMHPELTWELDITPPEENLLMQMRKTTRYLIRQAQKNKDIEIFQSPAFARAPAGEQKIDYNPPTTLPAFGWAPNIEKFDELYQTTVDRHHFIPFSLEYLKNEFLAFQSDNQISVFLGKYKNDLISSGIFIFWQNIAFYHHGASSLKYPKIPVSYLLLWEAIREAKRRGCQKFNFWGIAPIIENCKPSTEAKLGAGLVPHRNEVSGAGLKIENLREHPWAGLTLFKMGFGGYKKEYVKTQDLPLSKKYWLTYLFEKFRKTKRGF